MNSWSSGEKEKQIPTTPPGNLKLKKPVGIGRSGFNQDQQVEIATSTPKGNLTGAEGQSGSLRLWAGDPSSNKSQRVLRETESGIAYSYHCKFHRTQPDGRGTSFKDQSLSMQELGNYNLGVQAGVSTATGESFTEHGHHHAADTHASDDARLVFNNWNKGCYNFPALCMCICKHAHKRMCVYGSSACFHDQTQSDRASLLILKAVPSPFCILLSRKSNIYYWVLGHSEVWPN